MRPIDADAILHEIEELKKSPWYNDDSYPGSHAVRKEAVEIVEDLCIKDAPTISSTDIIFCKACKYCVNGQCWNTDGLDKFDGNVADDDFCSRGERSRR